MPHFVLRAALTASVLILSACGGGGGGTVAVNSQPVLTSPLAVSVPENSSGTVYTATASDADGDTFTFLLAGGADAARFRVTAAGAVSFVTPPDFELPTDSNKDNVYEVSLAIADGHSDTVIKTIKITVTNDAGGNVAVSRVGTGFSQPVFLTAIPDASGRVLVVERTGRIRILNPATGEIAADPFLDVTGQVATDGQRGLLGVALAPDFTTSGRAFVYLTATDGSIELRRYVTTTASKDVLDPASSDVILTIPHPNNTNNGGWIGFGLDGLLYVATGDGGGTGDPDHNGQNVSTLLGKMLRLDVSKDDFPDDATRDYGIPATNPYATSGGAKEVWLYGLRNPYRDSFDRGTGELWIGDVGQDAVEEIDRVQTSQTGLNLGWPLFEGTQPLQGSDPTGITMPVAQYSHGSGPLQGNSLIGGYVYRGPLEALQGHYIFADFISNNIWSVPSTGLTQGTTASSSSFTNRNAAFTPNVGTLTGISSFGEDQAGNLYIVTLGGSIFMLKAS